MYKVQLPQPLNKLPDKYHKLSLSKLSYGLRSLIEYSTPSFPSHKPPLLLLLGESPHHNCFPHHPAHSCQPAPCLPVLLKCHTFFDPCGRHSSSLHSRVYRLLEQYSMGWSHSSVGFRTKHSTTACQHPMSSTPSEFNSDTQPSHRMGDAESGNQCHVVPEWNRDIIKYQFQSSRRGSL